MANLPTGWGAGGAGGGEYESDKFTNPSRGGDGYIGVLILQFTHNIKNTHIKVNNNNKDFPIINIPNNHNHVSENCSIFNIKKLNYNIPQFKSGYVYTLNPLKIYDPQESKPSDTTFMEPIPLTATYRDNLKVVSSKLNHNNRFLKLLINTIIDDYNNLTIESYFSHYSIYSTSYNNLPSNPISLDNAICYVVMQAGGGGGGGADNTWGLLNYAAGGGGGGGGGACILRINALSRNLKVRLGSDSAWGAIPKGGADGGPNQASPAPGGHPGETALCRVTDVNDTTVAEVHTTGGQGGTRGYSNDAGNGGTHGNTQTIMGNSEILTILRIVDGGDGGKVGPGGACAVSGSSSYWDDLGLIRGDLSIDTTVGSGGTVGSQNDRGGGGGASYLGNGGSY